MTRQDPQAIWVRKIEAGPYNETPHIMAAFDIPGTKIKRHVMLSEEFPFTLYNIQLENEEYWASNGDEADEILEHYDDMDAVFDFSPSPIGLPPHAEEVLVKIPQPQKRTAFCSCVIQ